ncbi:HAMP domain-containing histidine kinase [Candidatus Gracilibacteria bacterium]|nr:HAMP domain-containing histidine kinase [Candidatus Gracilibacteria bacterium]
MFSRFQTSDKISFQFAIVNFLSLVLLLVAINIIYFVIWYHDQKQESLSDINRSYEAYSQDMSSQNMELFKSYILEQDSLIITPYGEVTCSEGVSKKIHEDIETIQNTYLYTLGDTTYYIFSKEYEGVGEVRVLFDITSYMNSQMIIIKLSLILILIFSLISFSLGKVLARGALQKLQQQTEQLKQFITDVSHELKTPLHVIQTKIQLFQAKCEKGVCKTTDYDDMLDTVQTNTKKLNNILETFLLLARFENSIEKFEKKKVCIKQVTEDIITGVMVLHPNRDIQITYDMKDDMCFSIEETSFTTLLENFITNAIKFSGDKVEITVGADNKSFYVQDNGIGISPENLNRIWEQFYREDYSKEGCGIGLFIVKRICDLYGWKIEVESKQGTGTTFRVFYS